MTRIIAGTARGRRLKVPPAGTRPTSDRVREALFSSLASVQDPAGTAVLDLYAGSGALGLEALSRGARRVVLVDSAAGAVSVLRHNVAAVGLPGAHVEKAVAADYLHRAGERFDLVLMDPPYELATEDLESLLADLARHRLVGGAVLVVERPARARPPHWPEGFVPQWNRRFGDTELFRAVWYGHEQGPS